MNKEQIENLTKWQKLSTTSIPLFHGFTCGKDRTDDKHLDDACYLVATEKGWECPFCDYTQIYTRYDKDLANKNVDIYIKNLRDVGLDI